MENKQIIEQLKDKYLTGVLLLSGNKSFGRYKKRLLYKCIPSDKSIPTFYIPYEINLREHSKNIKNKYIQFYFIDFTIESKFIGLITQTIGNIDSIESYYDYEAAKYNFTNSCLFSNKIKSWYGKGVFVEEYFDKYLYVSFENEDNSKSIENENIRDYIISIDPLNSKDLDDAIGYHLQDDKIILSVYITCVPLMLNVIQDWLLEPIKTTSVYLPNKVLNMLPKCLSENICSFKNKNNAALICDFIIDRNFNILDYKLSFDKIRVTHNYTYESSELLQDDKYKYLKNYIIDLNNKNKILQNITDSHDVVSYLMILMNTHVAKFLKQHNTGIFRYCKLKSKEEIETIHNHKNYESLPNTLKNFIELQKYNSGEYCLYNYLHSHDALNIEEYCHITSPIRRMSDFINMILLIQILNPKLLNDNAYKFAERWLNEEKVNILSNEFKNASKVSKKCGILDKCLRYPEFRNGKIITGYIYNVKHSTKIDAINKYIYDVYIPELFCSFIVKSQTKYQECDKVYLKVYIFLNNDTLVEKIRFKITELDENSQSNK
jgi:exoribonuclease R